MCSSAQMREGRETRTLNRGYCLLTVISDSRLTGGLLTIIPTPDIFGVVFREILMAAHSLGHRISQGEEFHGKKGMSTRQNSYLSRDGEERRQERVTSQPLLYLNRPFNQ